MSSRFKLADMDVEEIKTDMNNNAKLYYEQCFLIVRRDGSLYTIIQVHGLLH